MEIRIGVRQSTRELTVESNETAETITGQIDKAVADGGVLTLVDDKGRTVVVPVEALAYVELGPTEKGRVGFGAT